MMSAQPIASLPIVAITMGDPAGIGPEISLKAVWENEILSQCRPLIIGDASILSAVATKLSLKLPPVAAIGSVQSRADLDAQPFPLILDCAMIDAAIEPGKPTKACGEASYRYITDSIQLASDGIIDAVTTAPITKTTLNLAGVKEPGHTEIFGHHTGCPNFAMMLYSPRIAVTFVTCHQSFRSVPDALNVEDIVRVTELTRDTLRAIRGTEPKVAVCGLNPHAGEDRLFGDEDQDIVKPAVEAARAKGWDVEGPIPPDAAFMPHALKKFDGHVTLYHDQGSIPFKMISMHDGVNITMGLPIIRTSVDHGTAYDIAWQGKAAHSSLISAMQLAAKLAVAKTAQVSN